MKQREYTITCCAIWILAFALGFAIPPNSPLIWVPDALLLAGFLPLLFVSRLVWIWIVFGLTNIGIGFVLQVIEYLPDASFPSQVVLGKKHLADYHEPFAWMIFGSLTVLYGIACFFISIIKQLVLRHEKHKS